MQSKGIIISSSFIDLSLQIPALFWHLQMECLNRVLTITTICMCFQFLQELGCWNPLIACDSWLWLWLQVTAARLPYFDGDYWPGAAEDMIMQLQQQEEDGRNNALKKGKTKKAASSKRASKAVAQAEMASNASKDTQLMHKVQFISSPQMKAHLCLWDRYA